MQAARRRGGPGVAGFHGAKTVRLKFFTVPVFGGTSATEELDRFLTGHRVVVIDKEFVPDGRGSVWALCVSYDEPGERTTSPRRGAKIDYKEVLNEREFAVYARLRDLRKTLADKEGVPAYALFNNEQLAAMVRGHVTSCTALSEIPGVGAARVEKYGERFLAVIRDSAASLDGARGKEQADASK